MRGSDFVRRGWKWALYGLMWMAAFGAGYLWGQRSIERPAPADRWRLLEEAWALIETRFYGPLPEPRARVYGAVRGLVASLGDPHSTFVEPAAHREEIARLRGVEGGLPLHLQASAEGWRVYPFPDSAAAQAGIGAGDLLLQVGDRSISVDDSLEAVEAELRGPIGSPVQLTLRRPGAEATYQVTLIREEIPRPSAWGYVPETRPTLGYLRIAAFTARTPEEVRSVLEAFRREDVEGLVLDLRDNGGGLLEAAVEVAGMFVGRAPVAVEHRRGGHAVAHRPQGPGPLFDRPVAVLINRGTGSAAEILAAALAEQGRGFLIGETTFGKGSVQEIFTLSDGASIHLTVAEWRTGEGRPIEGNGLAPEIPLPPESLSGEEAVHQAIAALQARIEGSR
ncbi:S41 family peptidase [Thermoflexus sp.]|uniref:S41 family peptidase n=2 Tax=Thermoflexus sp. TaxID=1969742 RepID=UPI0025CD01DA|nr:S41 family peptidase [Thermoflexus sp.]MCS6962714.1 S41 family peptidase [Thermoflexus sp.]MCX7691338.1 S41 family peptidase [Thermoflexus sp.]MDW8184759.1 S41 family peptidase [Anaerolineae bacterium]